MIYGDRIRPKTKQPEDNYVLLQTFERICYVR